jgi:hypothetical protein
VASGCADRVAARAGLADCFAAAVAVEVGDGVGAGLGAAAVALASDP